VEKYHTYITNIPADRLDGEDIATLYSARWEIELIFKELKEQIRYRHPADVKPAGC
jgi:IS4 transposase